MPASPNSIGEPDEPVQRRRLQHYGLPDSGTREEGESQRYRAPLILVPVTLERSYARRLIGGFHDDEPRFNPTLQEMLRQT